MPDEYLPNQDRFDRAEARGTPLMTAIDELCFRSGKSLDDMERLTLGEIYDLAEATYQDGLPEFWRIWADWNVPDQEQPMGDL